MMWSIVVAIIGEPILGIVFHKAFNKLICHFSFGQPCEKQIGYNISMQQELVSTLLPLRMEKMQILKLHKATHNLSSFLRCFLPFLDICVVIFQLSVEDPR